MISSVSSDRSTRQPSAWIAALWLAVALTACGLGAAAVPAEEPTSQSVTAELKAAIDRARDKVFPSLVSIITVREYYSQGRKRLSRSGGSGTIITDQGHIVTNAHVAQDGTKFKVILADKREIDATLIGEDPASGGLLVEPVNRDDREELAHRPGVGHRLEHGEVPVVGGCKRPLEPLEIFRNVLHVADDAEDPLTAGPEDLLDTGATGQIEIAQVEEADRLLLELK